MQQNPQWGPPAGQPPMGQFGMPPQMSGPPPSMGPKTNVLAIIGLVLGILAWTIGWCCGGPIFALAGAICSFIAMNQIKAQPEIHGGRGLALAALIVNIVGLVLTTVAQIIAFATGAAQQMMQNMR